MEQIEKMYERQKRGRMKAAIVCVIVYFLMIGIVSLFYGNPFPHGYLLLLCGIIGLVAGIGSVIYRVINDYRALDRILLEECDAEKYLEVKLFFAEKLFLEEQYEEAAGILSHYKEKKIYNEVSRNYLLGRYKNGMGMYEIYG